MQIESLFDNNLHKKYLIKYSPEEIQECVHKEAEEMQSEVKMNGFRKGKVPVGQIIRIYGEKLEVEALNKKITNDIRTVIEQNQFKLAVNPVYSFRERTKTGDESFLIDVDFYLFPEISEIDFPAIELPYYKMDSGGMEATVENNLILFQLMTSEFKDKAGEKIEKNDRVVFDIEIEIDQELAPGLGGETKVLVGHNQIPPEIENHILGSSKGKEIKFTHSYAEDAKNVFYHGVLGKTVGFTVMIKDVQTPILNEMNDEKAKKLGFSDAENLLTVLEKNTRETLDKLSDGALKKALYTHLRESASIDIADFVIDQEAHIIAFNEQERLRAADMMERVTMGTANVEVTDKHRELAKKQLALGFILTNYAHKNEIVVSKEEVKREMENHLEELARMNRIKPEKKDENFREFTQRVQTLVFEAKTTDHILEKIKRKETFLLKDEFFDRVKIEN